MKNLLLHSRAAICSSSLAVTRALKASKFGLNLGHETMRESEISHRSLPLVIESKKDGSGRSDNPS